MTRYLTILLLMLAACVPATTSAVPLVLDYTGFSWSHLDGDIPTTFNAVGVVDGFSSPVNDQSEVYTFSLAGLTLSSVENLSATTKRYHYGGGDLGIFRSTGPENRGYDYGSSPEMSDPTPTFVDGSLWLAGSLQSFQVTINSALNLGTLTAEGQFASGEFLPSLGTDSWFSFAGLTARPGNGIPPGYQFRLDGQATSELPPSVPEPAGWVLLSGGAVALAALRLRRRSA